MMLYTGPVVLITKINITAVRVVIELYLVCWYRQLYE